MHRPVMDPDHPEYSNDDPTVARAQELAQVEAEIQMISAERDAMSQDNGFVERPADTDRTYGLSEQTRRLIETAANGKAIRIPRPMSLGNNGVTFQRRGLRVRVRKQPDGTYLAWCERITEGASSPGDAR